MDAKVNAFLHANAAGRKSNERCGPFHIGFDLRTDLIYLNYAVPESGASPSPDDVDALIAAFEKRSRTPRLEFAAAGAPDVEPALLAAGFSVEQRIPFMFVMPEELLTPPAPEGVEIVVFTEADAEAATDEELWGIALVQHEAFDEAEATEEKLAADAQGTRSSLRSGGSAVLARGAVGTANAGVPMGAGTLSPARLGTTEVGGIAVREQFRGRGIARALTARVTQAGFDDGLECLWLTPSGLPQQRLYMSIGYRNGGDMLFMVKP
jgi:ribosomal protein S18 acetylase RimI-like enzyme